jgi:pyruvate formate lyase activating enzyme
MQEAVLYEKQENDVVRCTACKWYCKIAPGKMGLCGIRGNKDGKLYLLTYGKAVATHIDPIEKKPLFHFLPGSTIFSIGTFGCNFGCLFCQNYTISQPTKEIKFSDLPNHFVNALSLIEEKSSALSPSEVVSFCSSEQIPSIAFTYNEPSIWSEYAHDIMEEGKKKGLRGVYVSSGYETPETMKYMKGKLDAINIDLKAFNDETYRKICKTRLEPVLETIKELAATDIWMEITTLVIPGMNDSDAELSDIASFIASLSKDIPWHVTEFHPDYKMLDTPPTSASTLKKAHAIGKKVGLNFVYTGNIPGIDGENTLCPSCGDVVLKRFGMQLIENNLVGGKCSCGQKIPGVWS